MNFGKGPSPEYLLLDYVQRLSASRAGRRAVHIHLSRLRPHHRQDHHIRISAATFESIVQSYEGQTFILGNSDIFFICKGADFGQLESAVRKVRGLFGDDPLTQGESDEDVARFCTWYDLETEFDGLIGTVKEIHRERERRARLSVTMSGPEFALSKASRRPIDPEQLAKLEEFLAQADLSNLMRRQPVCAISAHMKQPQTVFRELYISIAELQQTVLPDFELAGNTWLFKRLTQTLDNRMLALLIRNDDSSIASSISINLNIGTVLGSAFLNFDASLQAVARGTVVVELQNIDVFGDMGAYLFARDFMRERGYRVCLDGLNHLTIQYIDRERLGLDLLKMVWAPDMADDITGRRHRELKAHIDRAGRARIILCRCDSEEAVRYGQSLGLTMFQGRYVDRLVAGEREIA